MRTINSNQTVKIPRGIEATVKSRIVTIKGPRGVLKRNFKHLALDIQMISPRTLKVEKWFGTKKELAAVRTVCSHITNMIKGELVSIRKTAHCIVHLLCCSCWMLKNNEKKRIIRASNASASKLLKNTAQDPILIYHMH